MKERLIIIFVALIAGLFITSAGFFIYQSTKQTSDTPVAKTNPTTNGDSTETPSGLYVRVSEPTDEAITEKRTLTIKGTTNPDNIIVVSTNLEDIQGKPTQEGNFSVTVDIDAGANTVITRAISPTGASVQDIRTITYSTEEF